MSGWLTEPPAPGAAEEQGEGHLQGSAALQKAQPQEQHLPTTLGPRSPP